MAIEMFGGGLVIAAGDVNTDTAACTAQGIRQSTGLATNRSQLELVDAIAEAEFFALATLLGDQAGEISIEWVDATHFVINTFAPDGSPAAREVCFTVWRLERGAVASTPAPP